MSDKEKEGDDATERLPTVVDETDDVLDAAATAWLRADNIIKAINANLPEGAKPLVPIPKDYVFKKTDREMVSAAFHAAFQLCGGVPRLAQWADEDFGKFIGHYSKLLPSDTQMPVGTAVINIVSPIPETPADRTKLDDGGRAIEAEIVDEDDDDLADLDADEDE